MPMHPHGPERAINAHLLNPGFMDALEQAWCIQTCWPGCVKDYPENRADNPSFGNCLVSALAAWADGGFEGQVVPGLIDEQDWHFRLSRKLGREIIDPTWQQTREGASFRYCDTLIPYRRAEFMRVIHESLDDHSLRPRLDLLLRRMARAGYEVKHGAEEIVEKFRESYAHTCRPGFVNSPARLPRPRMG